MSLIALEGNLFDPKNLDTVPGYEASSTVSFSSSYITRLAILRSSIIPSFNFFGKAAWNEKKRPGFSAFADSVADPGSGAF